MKVVGRQLAAFPAWVIARLAELATLWEDEKICATGKTVSLIDIAAKLKSDEPLAFLLEDIQEDSLVAFCTEDLLLLAEEELKYLPKYKIVDRFYINKSYMEEQVREELRSVR